MDSGATWQVKDSGIPRQSPGSEYISGPRSLAIDPTDTSYVYAGTLLDGAYASTNSGENWTAITESLPAGASVKALALDPDHANRLSAILGQQYFVYEGGSWQKISEGIYAPNFGLWNYLYFHPSDPATIYSAGDMFTKSIDEGVNWSWDYDPEAGTVPEVAFHPSSPETVFACSSQTHDQSGGVYKTTDGGFYWSHTMQGITAVNITMVAIDPQNSSYIYAGDDTGHLYRSLDGGMTWGRKEVEPAPFDCWGIAIDPLDSQHIYVAGTLDLYESMDQGQTFTPVEEIEGDPYCLEIAPGASSPVFVGTFGQGIYTSPDGGVSWTQVNQGVPLCYQGSDICSIYSLAIDPNDTSTVWAGTQRDPYGAGGILNSTNGGANWELKGLHDDFIEAIAVQPGDSDTILVGARFTEGDIYKSTDGGNSWQLKLSGIAPVKQIIFDPRDPNTAYAATEGYGILRSRDAGETWHDYGEGIHYPVLYSLAITAEDLPLLVTGSYGSGVYWLRPDLENRPPDAPSSPVPADGANGVPLDQVLAWSGGDPDANPVTYTVAFGASSPPPVVATGLVTSTYDPGPLLTATTYCWVITATDGFSHTVGPEWSFRTIQPSYNAYLPLIARSFGGKQ
jgi:photosystem II stability/assembly factor-like uncharacterized protein